MSLTSSQLAQSRLHREVRVLESGTSSKTMAPASKAWAVVAGVGPGTYVLCMIFSN